MDIIMNNLDGKLIPCKNLCTYWLDSKTFCFSFDGTIDREGDEYFILCEYHIDEDKYIFLRVYEDDTTKTDFTEEQKEYLKSQMMKYMKEKINDKKEHSDCSLRKI